MYSGKILTGFTTLVLLWVTLISTTLAAVPQHQDNDDGIEWYAIANNVYQIHYKNYYTMFVVTNKGVVAFDPLSDEVAEHYIHAIKAVAPGKPLLAIIYSHRHTDHATGANVLRREYGDDVPVIAHERTLAYLKQRMVYTVDFANHDSVGWREMPGWPLDELIAMQKRLLKLDFDKVAFGHGRAGPGDRETISRQILYYKSLLAHARTAISDGLSEDETVIRVANDLPQYRGWANYDKWFRLNVRGAYRWIQEQDNAVKILLS